MKYGINRILSLGYLKLLLKCPLSYETGVTKEAVTDPPPPPPTTHMYTDPLIVDLINRQPHTETFVASYKRGSSLMI